MTKNQWKFTKEEKLDKLRKYCIAIREVWQSTAYEYRGGIPFEMAIDVIHFQKKKIKWRLIELRNEDGVSDEELKGIDPIIRDIIDDRFAY